MGNQATKQNRERTRRVLGYRKLGLTYAQIGKIMKISGERVRQIQRRYEAFGYGKIPDEVWK